MTLDLGLTGRAAILQRVRVLLATRRGTMPLDRQFGLDPDLLDRPGRHVAARVRADVVDQIRRYVPEALVTTVDVRPTGPDGRLSVAVTVEVDGAVAVVS